MVSSNVFITFISADHAESSTASKCTLRLLLPHEYVVKVLTSFSLYKMWKRPV